MDLGLVAALQENVARHAQIVCCSRFQRWAAPGLSFGPWGTHHEHEARLAQIVCFRRFPGLAAPGLDFAMPLLDSMRPGMRRSYFKAGRLPPGIPPS
jgi:hypothetical protein